MAGLRIATSDKFLLWFLGWRKVPLSIRQLAREVESYQTSHPDFHVYEDMLMASDRHFLADLDMMHEAGWIEIADGEGLDRIVSLTPFGRLSADLFEPHWEQATRSPEFQQCLDGMRQALHPEDPIAPPTTSESPKKLIL